MRASPARVHQGRVPFLRREPLQTGFITVVNQMQIRFWYESLSRRVSSDPVYHFGKKIGKQYWYTPHYETLSRALSSECTTSFPGKPNENIGTKINGNTRLMLRIVRFLFILVHVWSVLVHVRCVLDRFLFGCLLRIIDRYIFLVNNVI